MLDKGNVVHSEKPLNGLFQRFGKVRGATLAKCL